MRFAETRIRFLPSGPLFGLGLSMWLPLVMICARTPAVLPGWEETNNGSVLARHSKPRLGSRSRPFSKPQLDTTKFHIAAAGFPAFVVHSKNASSLDLLIHAPLERREPNNDAPPRVDVPVKQLRHRTRVGSHKSG
jgi:hypothetical protein